tara:strand:+ start:330 stop:572 length:243 start_codon:yes stop_codon:yes gene_type:complete
MIVEVDKMSNELVNNAGRISSNVYEKKEKRIENLKECLILFNQCFFKMMYYKQEMITWKEKSIKKELEFVNFVTKNISNE